MFYYSFSVYGCDSSECIAKGRFSSIYELAIPDAAAKARMLANAFVGSEDVTCVIVAADTLEHVYSFRTSEYL